MIRICWWLVWLLIMAAAAGCLIMAVEIELQVRAGVGRGLWRAISYTLYGRYIYDYRSQVAWLALASPLLLMLAYIIRPWGRRSRSDNKGEGMDA